MEAIDQSINCNKGTVISSHSYISAMYNTFIICHPLIISFQTSTLVIKEL